MKLNFKKMAVMVTAVVLTANVMAQMSFNVGYLNDTRMQTTKLNNNTSTGTTTYNGFTLGISYSHEFSDMLGINAGLNYQFLFKHDEINLPVSKTDITTTFHALDIPIRLELGINLTNDFRLFGYVGPKFIFDVAGKTKNKVIAIVNGEEQGDPVKTETDLFKDTDYSRFNLAVGPGLGIKYNNTMFRVGYDWGLLNRNTNSNTNNNFILKNNQLYVTLGFAF